MGFVMDIMLTPMGAQDVGYKFLTLVADKAA